MPRVLLVGGRALLALAPVVAHAGFEVAYEVSVTEALDRLQTYVADVVVLRTADATAECMIELRGAAPRCRVLAFQEAGTEPGAVPDVTLASPDDCEELVAALWRVTQP